MEISSDNISATRSRMRYAYFFLGIYLLIQALVYISNEWRAAHGEWLGPYYSNLLLSPLMILICFIAFVRMVFKRAFKPALVYAVIILNIFLIPSIIDKITPSKMTVGAYFFSLYPQLCPYHYFRPQKGLSSYVCYQYASDFQGCGSFERLIFNPGDELSHPPSQWPKEITMGTLGLNHSDLHDDDCFYRKTKLITNHIYWISDDCSKCR